jgi:hypothetical protein
MSVGQALGLRRPLRAPERLLGIFTLLALLSPSLFPQAQPRIAISAPKSWLVVAETVQLEVTVRDANGNVVTNPQVTWAGSELVRVDNRGNATAMGFGTGARCAVSAQSGGFNASMQFYCMPYRIDLQPSQADLTVGEQLQFTARVLDFNGEVLPNANVALNWQVTGANGGQINAARIDQSGLFTAVGTGLITVRARFEIPSMPGRVQQIWDAATVRIQPQRFYRVRRLISSDEVRHSFTLRPTGQAAAINENGQIALTASLDGLATALLSYDRGAVRLITQGGLLLLNGFTDSPTGAAINNRGEILASFWIHPVSQGLLLHTRDGPQYLLFGRQSIGLIENIRPDNVQRGSLNDAGQVVFRANFQLSGSTRDYAGLFRIASRRLELLVSNEAPLPGMGATNFGFEQFGIDGEGTVYFVASRLGVSFDDPNARVLYRLQPPGQPERLLTAANIRDLTVSKNSGVAVTVDARDRPRRLLRFRGSQQTEFDSGVGTIYQVSDAAGVLFNYCGSAGCGVGQWKDGAVTQLLLQGRLAPNGEPITGIAAAAVSPAGVLTAQVATAENQFLLMQAAPAQVRLLQAGDRIDVDAGLHFRWTTSLLRGGPGGPLYLALGGPPSLFEYDNGALLPRLLAGDRLPSGTFNGGLMSTSTGDIFFSLQGSAHRFRNGAVDVLFPQGMRLPDGNILDSIGVRAVNSRGTMVVTGVARPPAGGPGSFVSYLVDSGRTQMRPFGGRLPDGRTITNLHEIYLDDNERVVFRPDLDGQNVSTYYIWANGRIEVLIPEGRKQFGDVAVTSFNVHGARGPYFFGFGFTPGAQDQAIFGYAAEGWQPAIHNNYRMPDGSIGNYGFGAWDANARGEIAFVTGALALNVRTASGELRQVLSMLAPTPEGDYLRSVQEIDFRDDGRIFFTAFEATGRYSVYVAEPLQ